MSLLENYRERYTCARLSRSDDGILEVSLHTDGGPLLWGVDPHNVHEQIGQLFYDIGHDRENRLVILTGTGDNFCVGGHPSQSLERLGPRWWDRVFKEGKDLLMNLMDIEVPIIGVANGPAHYHAELLLLSDIVIASERASFGDTAHIPNGIVPSDGVHIVWQMLLGINRARALLLTSQILPARQALDLGLVHEVVSPGKELGRAREHAARLAVKPDLMLRYSRAAMTQHIKRRLLDDLGFGLAVEGLAALSRYGANHEQAKMP